MTQPISPQELMARRRRGQELLRSPPATADRARVGVLSTFNLALLPPLLAEALDRAGVAVDIHLGEFGQVALEALSPASGLHAFAPDEVVVVPAAEDLLAPLFKGALGADDPEVAAFVDERLVELRASVVALLDQLPGATLYVVAFAGHDVPVAHVLDPVAARRGQWAVEALLAGIRDLGDLSARVVVVDWEWHSRALGTAAVGDDRLWYLARMRLSPMGVAALADVCTRYVAAYRGRARKVLAVDLDDTLWGGVVGETGLSGLALGDEGIGLAFQDLQRELLKLRAVGVLLTVCSKNDRADIVEVFERHPGMVLGLEDFAAERINWRDKGSNLRELAAELNLGLDAFVFLDDNPVERGWIASSLPDVVVPDMPEDPVLRPRFLRELSLFDRLTVTDADLQRTRSYEEQRDRGRLLIESPSIEGYLRSLRQVATIEPVHEGSLARAAQLCQRTSQFNLTTRRHTIANLERMMAHEDYEVYTLALADRFGDSGITGLAILAFTDGDAAIETFLLSCRVLGRRVEDLFLAFLAARAKTRAARRLVGCRVSTSKNGQTERFYPDRGFVADGDGAFRLDLDRGGLGYPDEIALNVVSHA
ncbi:MAG: hypothetical protein QOI62_2268 [Solirubrobacteraceae bacterium]|jgi:FkbH-like protein|nr:hypothetical protein [Solirubrobacteraceae bacterium]